MYVLVRCSHGRNKRYVNLVYFTWCMSTNCAQIQKRGRIFFSGKHNRLGSNYHSSYFYEDITASKILRDGKYRSYLDFRFNFIARVGGPVRELSRLSLL